MQSSALVVGCGHGFSYGAESSACGTPLTPSLGGVLGRAMGNTWGTGASPVQKEECSSPSERARRPFSQGSLPTRLRG